MIEKRGINCIRREKRVPGTPDEEEPIEKGASSCGGSCSGKKKIVTCSKCGKKFEKTCAEDYLCEVVNTKCPACGGELS